MDPIQILEMVNAFYSDAFNKLITITVLIVGFGGFVLPFILQYIQNVSLRKERDVLKSQLLDELSKDLNEAFQEQETNLKFQLQKDYIQATGQLRFLQGRINFQNKLFAQATEDCIVASINYLNCENERDLQRAINTLISDCLPNLYAIDFTNNLNNLDMLFTDLLQALAANNQNGRYSDSIQYINYGLNEAKKRTIPAPVTTTIG